MKPFIPQKLPLKGIAWESLIPLIGKANRSLAHYDGALLGVPNPRVLLSPLTTQEAVLSSKIEGTQVTLGEVFKYEAGEEPAQESRKEDIREIINYRRALRYAESALRKKPFHLNMLLKLHYILLDSVRGRDKGRGRVRTKQNYIGTIGRPIEEADFIPPEPKLVMDCLYNLEKYYHEESLDPLVQLAIIHAQFEIIHPFEDGNGRIGRILIPIFLYENDILSKPMFYLSSYLEEHRDEYISCLRNIGNDKDAWNEWIKFFLNAIDEQSRQNAIKAREIMELYERLKARTIELTHSQYAVPLLDRIFERPVFQSTHLKFPKSHRPSRQAVARLLRTLKEEGVLRVLREGGGRRAQVLILPDLINICEGRNVV